MKKLLLSMLLLACGAARGQTSHMPAAPMMPDGSTDMYVGAGIVSNAKYPGSDQRRTRAAVLVQVQWSNGVFLSGLSLGMHLSQTAGVEYGPLLAIEPGRDLSGAHSASRVTDIGPTFGPSRLTPVSIPDVPSRPEIGGFFNYYFNEQCRITSSLLYGAGEDRRGLLWNAGLQKSYAVAGSHHRLSTTVGFNWANRQYLQDYFSVLPTQAATPSGAYAPSSGLRDVRLTFNWNWQLSTQWLLASQLSATRLMAQAADSPLVDRRNEIAIRSGLAYRF